MQTKYANLMLTIIAICLIYQVVDSVLLRANKGSIPVTVQNENISVEWGGVGPLPVQIDDVNLTEPAGFDASRDAIPVRVVR